MGEVLDRAAVDRVLRRASELAAADGDPHDDGDGGVDVALRAGVDADALVAAAVEAGFPVAAVRRSLAIERLGPSPSRQVGDCVVGPSIVVDDHELAASAADVLDRLDRWLVGGHHLRRDRLRAGRGEWSRRSGVVAAAMRSVRHATGEGHLGELERIAVTACDTDAGTCVVRIAADRRRDRTARAASGVAVGASVTAGVVGIAVVTGPLALLVAPLALAAGAGVAATGRHRARRIAVEIDRLVEAVDRQAAPARLSADVARRVIGPRRG